METYAKQSKSSARTLSARAGHGQPDMATILQAYRNRTAQLAALTDDDEQALQGKFTTQLQEDDDEALQGKFVAQLQSDDEEEPLQGKFLTQLQSAEEEEPLQQKAENRTGLPDQLKSGVENLSGYSLDAVKVHYNSPKPAQLQALAYTQGTDIHVGPGQERYLGHEAWHVVQQMQGRVQPTTQLQGVAVNDNEGLEREADVMGGKAVTQMKKKVIQRQSFYKIFNDNGNGLPQIANPTTYTTLGVRKSEVEASEVDGKIRSTERVPQGMSLLSNVTSAKSSAHNVLINQHVFKIDNPYSPKLSVIKDPAQANHYLWGPKYKSGLKYNELDSYIKQTRNKWAIVSTWTAAGWNP